MKPGKASIVIPSYNHGAYVRAAILSVIQQKFDNIELLVIDDGSTDGSQPTITKLAKQHGFEAILQSHRGLTATLNRALAIVDGEFFSMLSSDDLLRPDKTRVLVEYLRSHPEVGGVGGRHITIDCDGNEVGESRKCEESVADFREIYSGAKPLPSAPTMMYRTECIREVGGYDESIDLEDIDMWLRVAHAGYKIATLPLCLAYYRKHKGNTYKNLELTYRGLLASYGRYRDNPLWPEQRYRIQKDHFCSAAKIGQPLAETIWQEMEFRGLDWRLAKAWLRMRFLS